MNKFCVKKPFKTFDAAERVAGKDEPIYFCFCCECYHVKPKYRTRSRRYEIPKKNQRIEY